MSSTFLLIFLMLSIGVAGWLLFLWAVKSGQYDDIEGPKYRMLDDEEEGDKKNEPHDSAPGPIKK
jgi:cbb3-type cytochrome oxidase maturation protein